MHMCAGGAPLGAAHAIGRRWDFALLEVFDETSLWKRMDQADEMATVATAHPVLRVLRDEHAHPCLRLQARKG